MNTFHQRRKSTRKLICDSILDLNCPFDPRVKATRPEAKDATHDLRSSVAAYSFTQELTAISTYATALTRSQSDAILPRQIPFHTAHVGYVAVCCSNHIRTYRSCQGNLHAIFVFRAPNFRVSKCRRLSCTRHSAIDLTACDYCVTSTRRGIFQRLISKFWG